MVRGPGFGLGAAVRTARRVIAAVGVILNPYDKGWVVTMDH